jgi:hypothetical protein
MGTELMTMFSKFELPWDSIVVYEAYVNPISVSVNLGQGLGVSFSLGGGAFGSYSRATSFPALCDRANVKFAGVCL